MLIFPQLTEDAAAQFPIRKIRRKRTVANCLEDASRITLSDPGGEITEWQLTYEGLSDQEASTLQQFFTLAEGQLQPFLFLDPAANLFSWSEQLDHAAWTKDPLLSLSAGVNDSGAGLAAWHLRNAGAAPQRLSQVVSAPGGYTYCFSVYGRTSQPTPVVLFRAGAESTQMVN